MARYPRVAREDSCNGKDRMPFRSLQTLALLVLLLLSASPPAANGQDSAGARAVVFFPIRKAINARLTETLRRDIDLAISEHELRFLVIELDTPGGELEASRELAAYLSALDQRGVETFAWVPSGRYAYSGGTLVGLACRTLVMGDNSRIGDVQPIDIFGRELPEKVQTTVRADMRRYSRERGYPVALAEAMVSKDLVVFEVSERDASGIRTRYMTQQQLDDLDLTQRRTLQPRRVVEEGQLLTIDEKEAFDFGFIQHICTSPEQLLLDHGLNGPIVDIDQFLGRQRISGDSEILDFFSGWPSFAKFLLILVAALSLVVELKLPGVGLGSILSLTFFALFLLCGYADGNVGWTEITLFAGGILLMALELFVIPGFGISGIFGLAAIFACLVLAMQPVDAALDLQQLSSSGLLVLGGLGGGPDPDLAHPPLPSRRQSGWGADLELEPGQR